MIPSHVSSRTQSHDRQFHLHPKTPPMSFARDGGPMIVKGLGSHVWDSKGKRYLDAVAGLANVNIGYGRQEIVEAIQRQATQLSYSHCFTGFSNPVVAELSGELARIMEGRLTSFFYVSSGSEAIDTAVKLAHHYWRLRGQKRRVRIVSRQSAYHGNTIYASALTGMAEYHDQFVLPLASVTHIEAPYHFINAPDQDADSYGKHAADALLREIERHGAETIAAFIAEPIQASGGCIIPPASYWPRIAEICRMHDILLIIDEVITGFGRLGHWLGGDAFSIEPDIVAMAKGISSGYIPMGAVGLSPRVAEAVLASDDYLMHGFSASGHPVACAATIANIRVIENEALLQAAQFEQGMRFRHALASLSSRAIVAETRAVGMAGCLELDAARIGIEAGIAFERPAAVLQQICRNLGLLVRGSEKVVLLSPPLSISDGEIDEMLAILGFALTAFEASPPTD